MRARNDEAADEDALAGLDAQPGGEIQELIRIKRERDCRRPCRRRGQLRGRNDHRGAKLRSISGERLCRCGGDARDVRRESKADIEQHVPGSVGRYGRLAEKDLAFAETRGIGGSVRVTIQDEVRRGVAVEASVNRQDAVRTEGRVDQRNILERVGAGIRIARVVRRTAIIAQIDPEVPVIMNEICGKVAPDVRST